MVGYSSIEGFEFTQQRSVLNGQFVGLALGQHLQHLLINQHIDVWLDEVLATLHLLGNLDF